MKQLKSLYVVMVQNFIILFESVLQNGHPFPEFLSSGETEFTVTQEL